MDNQQTPLKSHTCNLYLSHIDTVTICLVDHVAYVGKTRPTLKPTSCLVYILLSTTYLVI